MPIKPLFLNTNKYAIVMVLISSLLYGLFAYDLQRTEYTKLMLLYTALFFLFYKLVHVWKHQPTYLMAVAFIFRAIFILAIPNLSQDFYRFIWDGRLIMQGFNPYLHTVESFISNNEFPIAQAEELYLGMGTLNASHFSNYPPLNQFCFVIAAVFSGKSILGAVATMRLLIIAADFGTLYFGSKLLKKLNLSVYTIFWFILNPFIIIELTGNLHFESVMIFFLIWSLYLLHSGKWQLAACILALSISVKLIPLMFMPLFFQWFLKQGNNLNKPVRNKKTIASCFPKEIKTHYNRQGMKTFIAFSLLVLLISGLLFLPFFSSQFIKNYTKTVGLWFYSFEFNASLYYVFREIGYMFSGYNQIALIGKVTPMVVIVFVLIITFYKKNITSTQLISSMIMVLSFYYFTASTVHPWYIAMLLILSVFTTYKFPLVWSFVIILSYLSYMDVGKADKSENLWIIALEYGVVFGVLLYELIAKKNANGSLV
ncbi:mannosyltransferase [Mariniflexile ostreae]|uniref:Mannosyltransferase n=1 Tax=Mariniflexile ostreae TaxID=1520892 RepID=A0ABV5FDD9_9FLAO